MATLTSVKKMRKKKEFFILFLCTGNTCRGVMAEAYCQKLLKQYRIRNVVVESAGVMTVPGLLPTPEVRTLLKQEGIELERHLSKPLTRDMIRRADLILGMTPFHVQSAIRLSPEAKGKTFLLKEYIGEGSGKKYRIPDPMGCTMEVYTRVFEEIKHCCEKLVQQEFLKPAKKKALRKPTPKKPTPKKPAPKKPAPKKPAPKKPKPKKPKPKKPAPKKPKPKKLKPKKPKPKKPKPKKPKPKKPKPKKPKPKKPKPKKPKPKKAVRKKTAPRKPSAKKPARKRPKPQKTARKKTATRKHTTKKAVAKKKKKKTTSRR